MSDASSQGRHPWSLLGIEPTAEASVIRKAYAERLKAMDVDNDVSGYAQLRQARDLALRLARVMGETPDSDVPNGTEDVPNATERPEPAPPRWTFAAPALPGAWDEFADPAARPLATQSLSTKPGELDASTMLERMAWAAAAARDTEQGGVTGAGIPLTTIDPFTAPLLSGSFVGDDALGLRPGETPAERLTILLDPERDNSGEPLSETETRQATRALRAILDEATQAHVSRQQQIEDWLAEILARGWPRSAPLLEDANQAFGWEREWSAHDARPAVQFLGARLRGYRFQQNVLQPDHRFHKAWNELVKPGKAGPFRMLGGPAQSDVDALLRGVRKHFPELESHFAPERVASWESGNRLLTGLLVLLGILAFAIVVAIADSSNPSPHPTHDAPASEMQAPQSGEVSDVVQASVVEAFGQGRDASWLWKNQPDLAQTLTSNTLMGVHAGTDRGAMIDKAVTLVRMRSYLNGRKLSGELFETAMQLRLVQLQAAREQSAHACRQMSDSGWLDGALPLSPEQRAKERAFAARLVEQHALGMPKPDGQHSAMIPGELIGKILKSTKLGQNDVIAALNGKGSDAHRCAVTIALLEATLDWTGSNRRDILMTL
ncbi:hypothetical protein EDF56_105479 [Novosphingobium sp. PhB165]|uniref:hypothetical protein n=1 Tax=Novosphingobium sp. PhB165 TaxID=2485105 RepID=UPI001050A2A2|nr:hypothetical protein [Novosphingobium sp. PhB165]TCM18129.1 hypothetical protein EDF56_105479 [Novosphingobium sp. PhB165]